MNSEELLQCYNRGCGQKYKAGENNEDSCRHHPGDPFFHDAYKGWSCCNKKCTDFTEFLNIKGCTVSCHSSVKPPEPEKPVKSNAADNEVIEVKPLIRASIERPSFDTPLILMKPEVAPSLKTPIATSPIENKQINETGEINIGTLCKNGGCTVSFEGPQTNETPCIYHSGYPVFHEGMKFWSCCNKKTSDFNSFLNQIGCETGKHLWIKADTDHQNVDCRWDYHQTGTHVIVSIYAKQYCSEKSEIKLNPIRLYANLVFPLQGNAAFNIDVELRGVVDVKNSQVSMYGTKVEIKLKKAEPGSWAKLDIPREIQNTDKSAGKGTKVETLESQVESVDLSDL